MIKYYDKNELAERLKINIQTLTKWIRLKKIPHIKLGDNKHSRILFDPEKVEEYLKKFEVNAPINKKNLKRDLSWADNFYPYRDEKGNIVFINEVNPNDKHDTQAWGRVDL
jgi:excisionase family DNA binding protein